MKIDFDQNEVRIEIEGLEYNLHPLWIRERSNEENMVDQNSLQRLYDPEKLPVDLKISNLTHINKEKVRIKFSDDHAAEYCLKSLAKELQRSKGLPEKILWDNSNIELKNFEFNYDENIFSEDNDFSQYQYTINFDEIEENKGETKNE